MNSEKKPTASVRRQPGIITFLTAGWIMSAFECAYVIAFKSPRFTTSTEHGLFFLSIFGQLVVFSVAAFIGWRIAVIVFRGILRYLAAGATIDWHRLPHHFIVLFTWIYAIVAYQAIRFFQSHFHNKDMITFSLAALLGFMTFAVGLAVAVAARATAPSEKNRSMVGKIIDYILNPYILSGVFLIGVYFYNREWLSVVLDIDAIIGLVLYGVIVWWVHVHFGLKKTGMSTFRWSIPVISLGMIAASLLTLNYSQNLQVTLHRNTILPARTLQAMTRLLPIQKIGSVVKPPEESGEFDLEQYFQAHVQDYPYDKRPIREIIGDTTNWNVIILSIDATRADHLSCYGYPFPTTPNIDKFAADGVLFERNFIQGGDSPNSINSFMSGIYPEHFRRGRTKMLKDILKENGFITCFVGYDALFKGHPFRQNYDDMVMFDTDYDEIWRRTTSEQMIPAIIDLVDKHRSDRFFIYSHLLDPHAGYVRSPETAKMKGSPTMTYDGEICHTDKYVGQLIDHLRETGLLDHTLLYITADHGEEIRDHGHRWHGKFLYTESIRTPLVANFPHLKGRRVKLPTGSVDITPTILAFLDIQPDPPREGTNLLPLLYHGDYSQLPPVYSMIPNSTYRKFGIIYGPWKLIFNKNQKTFELYNIDDDPKEQLNQVDRYIKLASMLKQKLADHFKGTVRIPDVTMDNAAPKSSVPETGSKKAQRRQNTGKKKDTNEKAAADIRQKRLNEPRDADFGPDGRYAVADFRNYRVVIFDKTGHLVRTFGTNGKKSGGFQDLCGIDYAPDGSIYIADTFHQDVVKYKDDGTFVWKVRKRFSYPMDVVLGKDGLWISNTGAHEIVKVSLDGKVIKTVGRKGSKPGEFMKPVGLAAAADGSIYVADTGNRRIQQFDSNGTYIRSIPVDGWQSHTFTLPYLCLDEDGHLFVSDPPNHRILIFDEKTGQEMGQYPPRGHGRSSPFLFPMGLSYDAGNKRLLIVDCRHNRILRINTSRLLGRSRPAEEKKSEKRASRKN